MILLSISIPTYNRKLLLSKRLQKLIFFYLSLDEESRSKLEIVVCDNCSSDGTYEMLQDYTQHTFVHYFRNAENLGIDGNIHNSIEKSRGKYVHLLSDDDEIETKLYTQLLKFLNTYEVNFLFLSPSLRKISKTPSCNDNLVKPCLFPANNHIFEVRKDAMLYGAGIWLTFISSFLVKRSAWRAVINRHCFIGSDIYLTCVALQIIALDKGLYVLNSDYLRVTPAFTGSYRILHAFLFSWINVLNSLSLLGFADSAITEVRRSTFNAYMPGYIRLAKANGQLNGRSYLHILGRLLQYVPSSLLSIAFLLIPEKILAFLLRLRKSLNSLITNSRLFIS